jgi:hypothetical protein
MSVICTESDKHIEKPKEEIAGCCGNFKKWLFEPFAFVTVTFIDQKYILYAKPATLNSNLLSHLSDLKNKNCFFCQ